MNDTVTPQAPARTGDDPLVHMAAALRALNARRREVDRRELEQADGAAREAVQRWRDGHALAVEHLEQAIAAVPASAPPEAVLQALIALGRTQALQDRHDDAALGDELALIQQLLRSALPVLAQSAGVDLRAYGAEHYGLTEPAAPVTPAGC